MSTRYEYKFLLSLDQYTYLKSIFDIVFERDAYSKEGAYSIFSSYYDSIYGDFANQKIDGEYVHEKIRVRSYGKKFSFDFLESKRKCDNVQLKKRIKLYGKDPLTFLNDRTNDPTLEFMQGQFFIYNLRPMANVYYERLAYEKIISGKRLRLNFDSNILRLDPSEIEVVKEHFHTRQVLAYPLLEVKYDAKDLPGELVEILLKAGVSQTSFSKYIHSLSNSLNL